jgi:hypothetical protein
VPCGVTGTLRLVMVTVFVEGEEGAEEMDTLTPVQPHGSLSVGQNGSLCGHYSPPCLPLISSKRYDFRPKKSPKTSRDTLSKIAAY